MRKIKVGRLGYLPTWFLKKIISLSSGTLAVLLKMLSKGCYDYRGYINNKYRLKCYLEEIFFMIR